MDFLSAILFTFVCFMAIYVIYREGVLQTNFSIIFAVAAIAFSFILRIPQLGYISGDYTVFLSDWVQYFRENSGFFGLSDVVGNYNLPYLYFLAFFSYLPISDMFLIKLLSIIFDVVLAFAVSRVVLYYTNCKTRQLAAYVAVLFLPTAMLNGAMWAQCDSIFTAFAVLAFYYCIVGKPKTSMVFATISIAFKIQAIFFLPIYAIFWLTKKISLREIWVIPVTYLLTLAPAVLFGHPFSDAVTVYFRQVDGAGDVLNFNSSSIYGLIPYFYEADWLDFADTIGIALAFLLICTVILFVWLNRSRCSDATLLGIATLFVLGIPFFLPHMHDRYFFLADVFTLMLAIISPQYVMAFVFCLFGSLLGYHAYLKGVFLLTMDYGATTMIFALIIICIHISKSFKQDTNL